MKNLIYFIYLLIIFALTSCTGSMSHVPSVDRDRLNQEIRHQQDMVAKSKADTNVKNKKTLKEHQARLESVGVPIINSGIKLCKQMNIDKNATCEYKIELSKKDIINAYADGNKIFITEGMMFFLETDEELAVVLGHEYAHNLMGHVASTKKNAIFGTVAGTLLDILASSQGINTQGQLGSFGGKVGVIRYSQDFEREADYIGLYITKRAGFNIDNAPNLWRRMSINNSKAITMASSHPTNPERYLILQQVVAELKNKERNGSPLLPNLDLSK